VIDDTNCNFWPTDVEIWHIRPKLIRPGMHVGCLNEFFRYEIPSQDKHVVRLLSNRRSTAMHETFTKIKDKACLCPTDDITLIHGLSPKSGETKAAFTSSDIYLLRLAGSVEDRFSRKKESIKSTVWDFH